MKYTFLAAAAAVLYFSGCAHDEAVSTTTTTSEHSVRTAPVGATTATTVRSY